MLTRAAAIARRFRITRDTVKKLAIPAVLAVAAACESPQEPVVPDSLVAVSGDAQAAEVSTVLPDSIVVRVESRGRPLAGVPVRWTLEGGGWVGDLSAFETPTDSLGEARVVWRLGALAGTQRLTASVTGLDPVSFTAVAEPGPAAALRIEPDTIRLRAIGDTARVQVWSVDRFGNIVETQPRVSWFPSYPGIVDVSAGALVQALADGETSVEARLGTATGVLYTSVRLPVATLEMQLSEFVGFTGDTAQLGIVPRAADGTILFRNLLNWTATTPGVASVDATGLLTITGAGAATLTAEIDGATASIEVQGSLGSGVRVPSMLRFDSVMTAFLARHGLSGGAVAIARDGKLVYSRGYGLADRATGRVVEHDALFRVASVSKAITAATILQLVEQGQLQLDDSAFDWLDHLPPPAGTTEDPRLAQITVRDLLQHTAGWSIGPAGDPMFSTRVIAEQLGVAAPANADDIVRYMRGLPLDFDPGERFEYSNVGFTVLGRVIEAVTRRPYEEYVRSEVLAPLGITTARLGASRLAENSPLEVRYYYEGSTESVFPPHGPTAIPYGGFYIEAMDAHGGWAMSAPDLVRFGSSVDGNPVRPDMLAAGSLEAMTAQPGVWSGSNYHYGLGWWVQTLSNGRTYWHDGSLPGTTAVVARGVRGGVVWAAVFNGTIIPGQVLSTVWDAIFRTRIEDWPKHDLF